MIDSINNGAGAPSCSGNCDIVVQVTGLGHDEGTQYQKVRLQHFRKSKTSSVLLEATDKEEINTTTIVPSTLFKWGKNAITPSGQKTKLVIAVDGENGEVIHLPITDHFTPNGCSFIDGNDHYLSNRLRAFEPFTYILKDVNNKAYYAPCRTGYLYIFSENKLWRELVIDRDEDGVNYYKDINLETYRKKDTNNIFVYTKGPRKATGKPLRDIWMPEAFYDNQSFKLHIAYSDVPFSAERISYFEKNPTVLAKRCLPENNLQYPSNLGECVGRNELIEFSIENLHGYFEKAGYLENVKTKAKTALSRLLDDDKLILPEAFDSSEEFGAWHYHLLVGKKDLDQEEQAILEHLELIWGEDNTQKKAVNVWRNSKVRGINGLYVLDYNYYFLHHKFRIQQLIQLHQAFAKEAETKPHFLSARFIEKQRYIVKEFDENIKRLRRNSNKTGYKIYQDATLRLARERVTLAIKHYQKEIIINLDSELAIELFADMLSNENHEMDLVGHYNHLLELLLLIQLKESDYDSLAPIRNIEELDVDDISNKATKLRYKIYTDEDHPYHKMLLPNVEPETLESPLQPEMPKENLGDGIFNFGFWQKMAKDDVLSKKQEVITLNGLSASALYEESIFDALLDSSNTPYFKYTTSMLFKVVEKMNKLFDSIEKDYKQTIAMYRQASRNLREATAVLNRKLETYAKSHLVQNIHQSDYYEARRAKDVAQIQLKAAEIKLNNNTSKPVSTVQVKLKNKYYQLIRGVSGGKLDGLQYKLTDINDNSYYIIGITNKKTKPTIANKGMKFSAPKEPILKGISHRKAKKLKQIHLLVIPVDDPNTSVFQAGRDSKNTIKQSRSTIFNTVDTDLNSVKANHDKTQVEIDKVTNQQQRHQTAHNKAAEDFNSAQNDYKSVKKAHKVARVANKVGSPLILLLELNNLQTYYKYQYDFLVQTRGEARAIAGFATFAFETATHLLDCLNKLALATAPANRNVVISLLARKGLTILVERAGPVLSMVSLCITVADLFDAINKDDKSVLGNTILVAAGVASLISFAAIGSPLFGFGPIGWLLWSIALTVAGVGFLIFFSDSDLELWFTHGPFGYIKNEYKWANLKDNKVALHALLNILMQPQLSLTTNPTQNQVKEKINELQEKYKNVSNEYNKLKYVTTQEAQLEVARLEEDLEEISQDIDIYQNTANTLGSSNACIKIDFGLLGYFNFNHVDPSCHIKLYRYESFEIDASIYTPEEKQWSKQGYRYIQQPDDFIRYVENNNGSINYYIQAPIDTKVQPSVGNYKSDYVWVIAIQIKTELEENDQYYFFPTPSFREIKPYNTTHKEPIFLSGGEQEKFLEAEDIKQDYWFKYILKNDVLNNAARLLILEQQESKKQNIENQKDENNKHKVLEDYYREKVNLDPNAYRFK